MTENLFQAAVEGAQGFAAAMRGLANAEALTEPQFRAYEQQAEAAYRQARKAGATEEEGLLAIGPLIDTIVRAGASYGFELSAGVGGLVVAGKRYDLIFGVDHKPLS